MNPQNRVSHVQRKAFKRNSSSLVLRPLITRGFSITPCHAIQHDTKSLITLGFNLVCSRNKKVEGKRNLPDRSYAVAWTVRLSFFDRYALLSMIRMHFVASLNGGGAFESGRTCYRSSSLCDSVTVILWRRKVLEGFCWR
ncbi:unnamed protein product [Lathyrus oleraceus]